MKVKKLSNILLCLMMVLTVFAVIGPMNVFAETSSPTADFSWSPEPQDEGSPVQFTDLSTSFPDSIVAWSWDFGGLGTSTMQNPSFTFMDDGTYPVTLTVTDDDGSTDSESHEVTILDLAPTADFSWSPEPQDEGSAVVFTDLSVSYPDIIVSWAWDLGDGGTSSLQHPNHAYGDNGVYTVTLTVTDDDGDIDSCTWTVSITNVAPTASIDSVVSPVPGFILPNDVIEFTGSFTDPGTGDTHTIKWDFDDGTVLDDASLTETHAYTDAGEYEVTLTVTDDDGASDSVIVTITVNSPDEATEQINEYIQDIPEDVFDNNPEQLQNALYEKLIENEEGTAVLQLIDAGLYEEALDKLLHDIRPKCDGSVGGNPNNDWVTDPDEQAELLAMIDALIEHLETLI